MHILIVDDEALARSRLRTLLADCGGHTVAEAANLPGVGAAVTVSLPLQALEPEGHEDDD